MVKATGIVKFFNTKKGFGFITPDSGEKDLFVHANNLDDGTDTLTQGQKVEFDKEDGRKGPEAKNVHGL